MKGQFLNGQMECTRKEDPSAGYGVAVKKIMAYALRA